MEESFSQNAPATEHCAACYAAVSNDDAFCQTCGYPLKGTETEQQYFLSVRTAKEIDLAGAHDKIKRASTALYFIAGATLVSGFILYATAKDPELKNSLLIINIVLAVIYAGLGLWSRRKPLAAIIVGASLYLIIFLLNAIESPITILSGIIFKIFIVVYFVRGIKSAIEAEKLKKELNFE